MLDPGLMATFRGRIANPRYWRRTYVILRSYNRYDLATAEGAGALVDHLAGALAVCMTPAQRARAVRWLVAQRIDPQNRWHQLRMWNVVNGM